jgi:serine/threonine-protein kinase
VLDLDEAAAARDLDRADLAVELTGRAPHPVAAAGTVIWQDPPPGVAVPRGARVALTTSSGVPTVAVPDIIGLDFDLAQRLLAAAGLGVENADTVATARAPSGSVTGAEPAPGAPLALGGRVRLHLAK